MSDPLDGLFFDGDAVIRQKLAGALAGRVGIDSNHNVVRLLAPDGSARVRVLLGLLGQMALVLKNPDMPAGLLPRQISELTGITSGTVRPTVMKLVHDHVVIADEAGRYTVPFGQLDRAIAIINGGSSQEAA